MAGKSDYLENKILDHVLRNTSYTPAATIYVGLYTAAPTDAGGGTECTGNAYARTSVTFSAASGGATTNSADVVFPTAMGSWGGNVVAVGLFDASSAGNMLYWNTISSTAVANGDTVKFVAGDLDVTDD